MIAVIAHTDPRVPVRLGGYLADAGTRVFTAADVCTAVELCRAERADVLLAEATLDGDPIELLDRVKRDTELFRTAVVLIAESPAPGTVLEWLDRGADDVLLAPLDPADVLGRAFAAARTKALVEELTAQNSRMEELVFFDELTELRNRRAMLQELEMLLAGARRHDHQLSVLMFDVDNFKAINDTHGHRTGDEVLREIARRLRERLRREDVAGRMGGDELLVVLPETDAEGALTAAESLREAIAAGPVHTSAGPIDVTVSVGSAHWEGEDLGSLLHRADGALYAAKEAGRDRATAA